MRRIALPAVVATAVFVSALKFLAVDAGSHSASDTLYGAVVPIGLVWLLALGVIWVAARTMKGP